MVSHLVWFRDFLSFQRFLHLCLLSFCYCCSVAQSCQTLCDPIPVACQVFLFFTISWCLLKLLSIELKMPSSHFVLCHPLLLQPSVFSSITVFSSESALHIRWPKNWSFSFSIRPSNEHAGLISFRIDWLDLLEVQGTLKSLLQYHRSKASNLQHSAFWSNSHIHTWLPEKP